MWHLYLLLDIGSLSIPFLFSFHPKLKFYKLWKYFLPATAIMMALFVSWDIIFTANGFWGFNNEYLSGIYIAGLPLEEWLFFFCIPYACLFTTYSIKNLAPKFVFSDSAVDIVYALLQAINIGLLLYFYDRWYTFINFSYALILMALVYNFKREAYKVFFPVFLIILIPFFIVNGFLTGSWIEEQVVWYDNTQNLGIRIGTVPIEDSMYAFTMLLTVYVLMEKFRERYPSKNEIEA